MPEGRFERWLAQRAPEVPETFLPYLVSFGPDTPPTPQALTSMGVKAISKALKRPGRDRGAAFALLSGDAFLTYACEALAEEGDGVGIALESLIRSLGDTLL